ncbi:MAG TPA: ATP-binding protein [Pyrinomonadaceae bacterium]|nr:ATP-binding protein [Pyrinomonadaceae bacterium]
MMRLTRATPLLRSVRTKLLIMLAVLSLPLLIISLYQLNNYRRSLDDQMATIARIEAAAASGALASWLEDRPGYLEPSANIPAADALNLYELLGQSASLDPSMVIAVFNAQGRVLNNPATSGPRPLTLNFSSRAGRQQWSDGVTRMTSAKRTQPYGWVVAVGVPLAEHTLAGRSILMLATTWAFGLIASILIGVWAVRRFTKPLLKLATSASTLGEGNLQERVAVETDDEVGTLAQGFNVMAAQLQTKFNELQTQGAFIEEVIDGLPLGVAVLDASLIVRKANPTFARFVGRAPAALAGRGLYEAAAGLAVLSDVVEDVRRTRKPFVTYGLPLNLVARNREGAEEAESANYWDVTIWPTTERSAVRGDLIFILSEVSKRVRAEKLATAAFASERTRAAELESVINQMNEGVVIVDRHRHYKINPAAARIIGQKPGDFRNDVQALLDNVAVRSMDGRELAREERPLWRALERRENISGEQLKVLRANGEVRVVAISATPLVGDDGKQEGAVAVFRDITEEVEQHDKLVAAYDRLREHDRLKSAFVSNITHELRTPLNVIIGLCQLLERDPQLPLAPLQNEAVRRMERNARALVDLVNDLLDYSRLEAGRAALHLESVDVAGVISEVVEVRAAEAKEKRIELRTEVSTELREVYTDRHKLSQVLSNLIGNAIKFTAVGSVTVAAAPLDEERWYLEVSDTGIGMSNDALTYIFEEFRQVDERLARSYGGTGLGLAITRKIVELLEGQITVESEPKEGSRFRITWPRVVRQRTGTGSLVMPNSLLKKRAPSLAEPTALRLLR